MAKIWVEIVPTVLSDGDEAKSVLTKPIKEKIGKAMIKKTADGLPSNFSDKDGDKPKDKRDDHAARAVRLAEQLTIKLETTGSRVSMDGVLVLSLETLKLKSASEKGEAAGEYTRNAKGLEKRGTVDKVLDDLIEQLLKELDPGAFASKALNSTAFKRLAAQRNLPLD